MFRKSNPTHRASPQLQVAADAGGGGGAAPVAPSLTDVDLSDSTQWNLALAYRIWFEAMREHGERSPEARDARKDMLAIRKAFEDKTGRIILQYHTRNKSHRKSDGFRASAVYLEDGSLRILHWDPFPQGPDGADPEQFLYEVDNLATEVHAFDQQWPKQAPKNQPEGGKADAGGQDPAKPLEDAPGTIQRQNAKPESSGFRRSELSDRVGALATTTLAAMDDWAESAETPTDEKAWKAHLTNFREELSALRATHHRTWQKRAKVLYLQGVALGEVFVTLACWIIAQLASNHRRNGMDAGDLATIMFIGALAAALSVLTRIRSDAFGLKPGDSGWMTRYVGVSRPVVGAMMALGLYVLVSSQLLPIVIHQPEVNFYAALAFLGGFSERWARDMLMAPQQSLLGAAGGAKKNDAKTDEADA